MKTKELAFSRAVTPNRPQPPSHLSAASQKWFTSVVSGWVLSESDVKILTMAAEALDRSENSRKALLTEGLFYTDEKGIKHPHPAVGVESTSKKLAAKLISDLRLDMPPPRAPGRPGRPRNVIAEVIDHATPKTNES